MPRSKENRLNGAAKIDSSCRQTNKQTKQTNRNSTNFIEHVYKVQNHNTKKQKEQQTNRKKKQQPQKKNSIAFLSNNIIRTPSNLIVTYCPLVEHPLRATHNCPLFGHPTVHNCPLDGHFYAVVASVRPGNNLFCRTVYRSDRNKTICLSDNLLFGQK